jgi:hypothetical protein
MDLISHFKLSPPQGRSAGTPRLQAAAPAIKTYAARGGGAARKPNPAPDRDSWEAF